MLEVGPDTLGERGDAVHDGVSLLQELRIIAAGRLQAQRGLEVVIQVFVRIGLGRIGWQVEQLDLRGTRLDPGPDELGVMHPQVVDDQEHLARRTGDQSLEKLDEAFGVDRALYDLEGDLAPIGDGRDHRQLGPAGRCLEHGRAAGLRKASKGKLSCSGTFQRP